MGELTQIIAKYGPHPELLLLIIFLFSLGKSVIVVSSVLPPASVTLLMGILAGKHALPAGHLWAAITLGAALGSLLSFHCGALLCRNKPMAWLPVRFHAPLRKAQLALQQKGMPLLFASRFLAVMRYTVPLVAGMLALPRKQVYLTTTLSAALWAVALLAVAHLLPSF
ncbi:DedA family protein [Serratia entomophila]|uniref:DedA family protein n=1 Tax=Serratia entomophila TaxID=42906 RepID=UPI00217B5F5D|nr:VTT domain-containing protein [Serratia entomophila]CAI1049945.1 Inner membrane protein YghB [Serratia entomophila]CAI1611697.1 Inner membrane protein YghB [Serratia entomophila]